jgi:hypothetical protein
MSASNLYRGLFELLTVPPGADGALTSLATGSASRRELLGVARMEGCLPELYARWAAAGLLSASEGIEHEQQARRRAAAAEVLRVLPRGALLAGGSAARQGATPIDVLIPDLAAIGPLHEALAGVGYRLQDGGEWRVPVGGPMHKGVGACRYGAGTGMPGGVTVSVEVGGVGLDARRHLAFADLADHAPRLNGSACRVLDPTRELLHRIATFGARPAAVTVREIADIHLLLKAHAIDAAWLARKVDKLQAWAGLRQIREAIAAKRLGELLAWDRFGRLVEMSATRGEAAGARRTRRPRLGTLLRNTFGLVQAPRRNDAAARLARTPWLVARVLDAGYRVRGVPVSSKAFDVPRLMRIDGALYLATGAGLMLLSLVDLDEQARSRLGERVRTGGRPVVLARWAAARPRAEGR